MLRLTNAVAAGPKMDATTSLRTTPAREATYLFSRNRPASSVRPPTRRSSSQRDQFCTPRQFPMSVEESYLSKATSRAPNLFATTLRRSISFRSSAGFPLPMWRFRATANGSPTPLCPTTRCGAAAWMALSAYSLPIRLRRRHCRTGLQTEPKSLSFLLKSASPGRSF